MLIQLTFTYDGKNDRYEIQYNSVDHIQVVHVGGRAMAEMAKTDKIGDKEQQAVGNAIAEYLLINNISSLEDSPVFILPEIDMGIVNNALAITPKLLEICNKYLSE